MEYINKSFEEYQAYLEKNRNAFPKSVFDFANSLDRHSLNSAQSMHDAWLTSITVKENRNSSRPFEPSPTIELILLGQMHDREIVLTYYDVSSYVVEGHRNPYSWADTFHGDVSCHEVRLNDEGTVLHEIEFVSGSNIAITCKTFECKEVKIHNSLLDTDASRRST